MSLITRYRLSEDEYIFVESEPFTESGDTRLGLKSPFSQKGAAAPMLKDALKPVTKTLRTMHEALDSAIKGIDEVTLETKIKFIGESGIIISKVGGEASISVTLKWTRHKGE